jgi:hypothetical protein
MSLTIPTREDHKRVLCNSLGIKDVSQIKQHDTIPPKDIENVLQRMTANHPPYDLIFCGEGVIDRFSHMYSEITPFAGLQIRSLKGQGLDIFHYSTNRGPYKPSGSRMEIRSPRISTYLKEERAPRNKDHHQIRIQLLHSADFTLNVILNPQPDYRTGGIQDTFGEIDHQSDPSYFLPKLEAYSIGD